MHMNHTVISGNITRDPELRYLPTNNTPVCNFGLANNRPRKKKDGSGNEDDVSFFEIVVFGKQAEIVSQHCSKGTYVEVYGQLKQRRWETDQGKRDKVEINAREVNWPAKAKTDNYDEHGDAEPF